MTIPVSGDLPGTPLVPLRDARLSLSLSLSRETHQYLPLSLYISMLSLSLSIYIYIYVCIYTCMHVYRFCIDFAMAFNIRLALFKKHQHKHIS